MEIYGNRKMNFTKDMDYNELLNKKMLQFITNGESVDEIVSQVEQSLKGGCRWIQIRMKDFSDTDIESVLRKAVPLCRQHRAVCIMNDRVDMAKLHGMDGVHLGAEDMSVAEARDILGPDALIGVTANTIEQILELSQQSMSYFGIGPMRYTTTKKNLAPFIGLSGYHDIVDAMRQLEVTKPAVAIGGIRLTDVYDLLDAGLWGVAVSGAIADSGDIKGSTEKFMKIINGFE